MSEKEFLDNLDKEYEDSKKRVEKRLNSNAEISNCCNVNLDDIIFKINNISNEEIDKRFKIIDNAIGESLY